MTAVDDPAGNNAYTVTFDRSLVNCVVQATEGFGNPLIGSAASFDGFPSVNMVGTSNPNQVQVSFRHASGSPTTYATTDDSFMITAFC